MSVIRKFTVCDVIMLDLLAGAYFLFMFNKPTAMLIPGCVSVALLAHM